MAPVFMLIVFVIACLAILMYTRKKKFTEGYGEFKDSQMKFANSQYTYFHDVARQGVFVNPGLNKAGLNDALRQPDLYLPTSPDRDYTPYLQEDPENAYTDQDRQFCKTAKHPRDLPSRVTGSKTGCGWYFVADPSTPSVGVLGSREAPLFKDGLPANGEWLYDLAVAAQKEDIKICKRVKSCVLMDVDGIRGVCGFCERLGHAVPIKSDGTEKYPDSQEGSCGQATLNTSQDCSKPVLPNVTTPEGVSCGTFGRPSDDNTLRLYTSDECGKLGGMFHSNGECQKPGGGFFSWDCRELNTPQSISAGASGSGSGSSAVCAPTRNGTLSRECLISLALGLGYNKSGSILRMLYAANRPNDTDRQAIDVLQTAGIAVPDAVLGSGNIDTNSAANVYKRVFDAIATGQSNVVKQAAKWLVTGTSDFDPCDLPDNAKGPFPLACAQREFRKAGCQPAGAMSPSQANIGKYSGMSMGEMKKTFNTLNASMKSTDVATQDEAMKNCLGTSYYRDPPKECPTNESKHLGCFNDCQGGRAIPNIRSWNMQSGNNLKECEGLAKAAGDNIFGLQFYRECWSGKDVAYDRMGAASNCPPNGGSCTQQVYRTSEGNAEAAPNPGYVGCYKDNGSRMIPTYRGNVPNKDACAALAKKAGDNVMGLQYGGQCFTGKNPRYDALGLETNSANCPPLGGGWSNQVYKL